MAEGDLRVCPQVFVVDSHPNFASVPRRREPMAARVGQKFLLPLVVLTMLGLVVQGVFIYALYKKTEAFPFDDSFRFFLNRSDSKTYDQQVANLMSQVGSKEFNEIAIVRPQPTQIPQRPFAHLMGSNSPLGENNVVQWIHDSGDAITRNMGYDKGQLLVEKAGYYYFYSKVQLNAAVDCSFILHKVMKNTTAYGQSIELMRSKSFRCRHPKPTSTASVGQNIWNSFLAGIFHLESGDTIFVTLENIQQIRPGPADNFMGAFMIFP